MFCSVQNRAILLLTAAIAVSLSSCRTSCGGTDIFIPEAPDWSDTSSWYVSIPDEANTDRTADVFYILPTCIWDWHNEDGKLCRYSDADNAGHIQAFEPSVKLAESIFAQGKYGFYCPYYRQISLNVWMEGEEAVNELFPLSMEDVKDAFGYYLKNYNEGRPFILAGFSQGGKAVVELIKHTPEEVLSRMVAAYAIGYKVTEEELEQYPGLHPAIDSTGTGCIVSYNSVASPEAACTVLSPSDICINPVNWTTEAVPARLNDSVTVTVDTLHHLLLVDGLDPAYYYTPSLAPMFPQGNYHLQELNFYQSQLRRNTGLRVRKFLEQAGIQSGSK